MRLLVVEDDPALADALAAAFSHAAIAADFCATAGEARELVAGFHFDAAIVDRGLPDADGIDLVRDLRRAGNALPVIILTAQSDAVARVEGLESGADDYLGKPFLFAELRARINAVLRRTEGRVHSVLSCGNLHFDPASGIVSVDDRPLAVTPREREILEILLRAKGRPVSFARLEDQLCGPTQALSSNALEVSIHRLRRKLATAGCTAEPRTMRGLGYAIEAREC